MTYFEKLQKILRLAGGQQQVASVLGVPIARKNFSVLYGAYNRYILQIQVESVKFEENGLTTFLFCYSLSWKCL